MTTKEQVAWLMRRHNAAQAHCEEQLQDINQSLYRLGDGLRRGTIDGWRGSLELETVRERVRHLAMRVRATRTDV